MIEKKELENVDWKKYIHKKFRKYFRLKQGEEELYSKNYNLSDEINESGFIRKCVLYGGINYKENEIRHNELATSQKGILTQLFKIGTNINQIAIKINMYKSFSLEERKAINENLNELKRLIYVEILNK